MPAAWTKAGKLHFEEGHRSGRCSMTGLIMVLNSCSVFVRPVSAIEVPARYHKQGIIIMKCTCYQLDVNCL